MSFKFAPTEFVATARNITDTWQWKILPYLAPFITSQVMPYPVTGNVYRTITTYSGKSVEITTELWHSKSSIGKSDGLRGRTTYRYNLGL